MQRGFSIFLILFFGLGPLSTFIDGSEDASLPPCCRRHGTHHCAMSMRMAAMAHLPPDPRPAFDVPLTCPLYPGTWFAMLMPAHALAAAPATPQAVCTHSLAPIFLRATTHSSPNRTHAGRGPPAIQPI